MADWLLPELDSLYVEACEVFAALDGDGAEWSEETLAAVARLVRVARTSSQVDFLRPGECNLAQLRTIAYAPPHWPDATLLAGLALAAVLFAADHPDLADKYRSAAREALALVALHTMPRVNVASAAEAKRKTLEAQVKKFARRYKAERAKGCKDKAALLTVREKMKLSQSTAERYKKGAKERGLL